MLNSRRQADDPNESLCQKKRRRINSCWWFFGLLFSELSLTARLFLLACQTKKQTDKSSRFLIAFNSNKLRLLLLLPPWWEDLRGVKSTITVRLVKAQPALSPRRRSEGAGTLSVTPATHTGRQILLSVLLPFVLLFTPVYQFPPLTPRIQRFGDAQYISRRARSVPRGDVGSSGLNIWRGGWFGVAEGPLARLNGQEESQQPPPPPLQTPHNHHVHMFTQPRSPSLAPLTFMTPTN